MKYLFVLGAVLLASVAAFANITPSSATITGTGPYTWTYTVQIAADQQLVSGVAPFSNPVFHSNLNYGSFFTIYDFAGYVNGSCAGPAGWTCSAQKVGFTPDDVTVSDDPNIYNITWVYTSGATVTGPGTLTAFSAQSTFNVAGSVSYAGRAVATGTLQSGSIADNVGLTAAPTDAPLVPSCSSPSVFSGAGAAANSSMAAFEAAIGGANNGSNPPAASGFRSINWDAVTLDGSDFGGNTTPIVPSKITAIPTNRFQSRGVVFDRSHAVANDGFLSANPGAQFTAFSPQNTFAPYNANTVTVSFVIPSSSGAPVPAVTKGFGAIFLDVEDANTSSIEYFNGTSSLGKYFVPTGTSGQAEFVGVVWPAPIVTSVKITVGTNVLFFFNGTTEASGAADAPTGVDQAALDDFAFAEPQATTFGLTAVRGAMFNGTLTSFKDSGGTDLASDFLATINWGDGTTSTGTVSGSAGCFDVSGSHIYNSGGTFLLIITINDTGGAAGVINGTMRVTVTSSDFNGDGKGDLVLQTSADDSISNWLMNGTAPAQGQQLGTPTGWAPVATADINGDHSADIILQNRATGDVAVWLIGPSGDFVSSVYPIASPGANWHVITSGDFNHDGKDDLVLQDSSTGAVVIWLMNGAAIISGSTVATPHVEWQLVGSGDFDADGNRDLILQSNVTNAVAIWKMNGISLTAGQTIATPVSGWQVIAAADFDGDGKSDVLLQNSGTGNITIWSMNGFTLLGGHVVASPGTAWICKGATDFNSDGTADVVIQNSTTKAVVVYLINGGSVTTTGAPIMPPNTYTLMVSR